jgi:hypothetical protein
LYYYNARYYDPHLGRFIQPDTLVPDPLNPQAWNRFSYCYNNPVSYVDPSGHDPVTLLILGGAFLLGAGMGGYYAYHQGYGFDTWQFYAYAGMGGLAGVAGAATGMWIEAALLPAGATALQAFGAGAAGGFAAGVVEQSILEASGAAILGTEVSAERILFAGATGGITGGVSGMVAHWIRQRYIVYRNPGPGQHPSALHQGFRPKNPNANYSPAFHVSSGSRYPTQYVSMTRSLQAARRWQTPGVPIYRIDLRRVSGTIIDLTDDIVRNQLLLHPRTNAMARASAEVLLEGWIPPNAILGTIP